MDAQREQKLIKDQILDVEKKLTEVDIQETENKIKQAVQKMEEARNTKRMIASDVKGQICLQHELEHELKNYNLKIGQFASQIEKVEPIYGTLQRIETKCKEEGIKGYKGLLIDFIQCQSENFMPCVDIAAKSKLFSIIVDSFETAKTILDINKKINGGVITIYSLDDNFPKEARQIPQGCKSMMDIVKLTPDADEKLQNLLSNIFSKVVLVKSYDDGMTIAR